MAQDLLIKMTQSGYFDLEIDGSDLASVDGMETTIAVLLFTDARAASSEVYDIAKRRGWVGNILRTRELGGMLWLISQMRNEPADNNKIVKWANNCLQPLIDDGMASEVVVTIAKTDVRKVLLSIDVIIKGGEVKKFELWLNTDLGNLINAD